MSPACKKYITQNKLTPSIFFVFLATFFYAYLKPNLSKNEVTLQYFQPDSLVY